MTSKQRAGPGHPAEEPASLRVVSEGGSRPVFPRTVSRRSPPNNLPLQLTSFVDREGDVAGARGLLSGETRLLTLTGPGGCGKTRLALAVSEEMLEVFPDGVWFVGLAPITEAALVPRAVAAAVDVREQPARLLPETLSDHFVERAALLVLDNCEHLIDACAALADSLVGTCPNLRVLATSREPLGVAGETARVVPPLPMPDEEEGNDAARLARYGAVRLFVERATEALPVFALTDANAEDVARVCRKLDGVPLALELAAARVRTLPVEGISARLDDALRILNAGGRTAPDRHRSLRAALEWSHELLDEDERALFRRLSVFAGGLTLEAAEAVASDADGRGILDGISSLVDKSLLVAEAGESGVHRYGMLETIRQYAGELLESSGEGDGFRARHAAYYLALAEADEDGRPGGGMAPPLARLGLLQREGGNMRAALAWFFARGEEDRALRMAAAPGARSWDAYSPGERRGWLERGLAGTRASAGLRARALGELGFTAMFLGDYPRVVEAFEGSVERYEEIGDERGAAISLGYLGFAASQYGDAGRVSEFRRRAETLYGTLSDALGGGYLRMSMGLVEADGGDLERSIQLHEEAMVLLRGVGDYRGVTMCLIALGISALEQGRYGDARSLFEEDLRLLRKLGEKVLVHQGLLGMAAVFAARGEPARAARLWGADAALREALGLPLLRIYRTRYAYEDRRAAVLADLGEERWKAAWDEGRAMGLDAAVEHALEAPPEKPQPVYPAGLSHREVEVLGLVARGLTNAEVAGELYITARTVNGHLTSIYRKLGVSSRAAASSFAADNGLLEPSATKNR